MVSKSQLFLAKSLGMMLYLSSAPLNFAHHFVIYWLFQNGMNKSQHQDSYRRETIPDKFIFFSKLLMQKKSIGWAKYVYVCEWDMCWRNFCNFPLVTKKCESRSKIALFFQMSAILKFDIQKRKQLLRFSELSKLHKKRPNFACGNYIFPKTRGNKNKQWTHSKTP